MVLARKYDPYQSLQQALAYLAKETNFFASLQEELRTLYFEMAKLTEAQKQKNVTNRAVLLQIIVEKKLERERRSFAKTANLLTHLEKALESLIKKLKQKISEINSGSYDIDNLNLALDTLIKHQQELARALSSTGPLLRAIKTAESSNDFRQAALMMKRFFNDTLKPSQIILQAMSQHQNRYKMAFDTTSGRTNPEYDRTLIYEQVLYMVSLASRELERIGAFCSKADSNETKLVCKICRSLVLPEPIPAEKWIVDLNLTLSYFNALESSILNFLDKTEGLLVRIEEKIWGTEVLRSVNKLVRSCILIEKFRKNNSGSTSDYYSSLERSFLELETVVGLLRKKGSASTFILQNIDQDVKEFSSIEGI